MTIRVYAAAPVWTAGITFRPIVIVHAATNAHARCYDGVLRSAADGPTGARLIRPKRGILPYLSPRVGRPLTYRPTTVAVFVGQSRRFDDNPTRTRMAARTVGVESQRAEVILTDNVSRIADRGDATADRRGRRERCSRGCTRAAVNPPFVACVLKSLRRNVYGVFKNSPREEDTRTVLTAERAPRRRGRCTLAADVTRSRSKVSSSQSYRLTPRALRDCDAATPRRSELDWRRRQ
ncbi:hypothetical protein EVAR_34346_1 [Eumeta japonica]|uniref:Uncharacterized protein n=1 Tax=Eumeta variegata TaxID=151549 RepID=A0A4C1VDI8_EUMVA|nr:hypothetical protein EVAR_34346_1 [Eumeta japonica]